MSQTGHSLGASRARGAADAAASPQPSCNGHIMSAFHLPPNFDTVRLRATAPYFQLGK